MDICKENIKYYLPITFLADMKKDINLAFDNWKIKYENIKKNSKNNDLFELEKMNNLVNEFYYWSKVNC